MIPSMTMDLIFSAVFLVFSIYCFFYIGAVDNGTATELGAAAWPRVILGLMIVLFAVSIFNMLTKKNGLLPFTKEGFNAFLHSKLILGMLICAGAAIILPYVGFIPTCALFLVVYGILLGERRPKVLALTAVVATLIIYIIFQGPLGIFLPRGYGFLRNFALTMESLIGLIPGL